MLTLHLRMAIIPTLRLHKATTAMTATMLMLHPQKITSSTAGVQMRSHVRFWHLADTSVAGLEVGF
jgi:hypothetical protein